VNVAGLLGPLLTGVGKAAGLIDASGNLDASWFGDPLQRLESILTDATQRAAVLDLLDRIAPPDDVAGAPPQEKWHPLLGAQPHGNLYAIVDDSADPTIVIGIGGAYRGGGTPGASLLFRLPIARLSAAGFDAIAGSAAGPLTLTLAVALEWTRPAHAIALDAISLALRFAPLASPVVADVVVVLHGLDLDGHGAHDVTLDPQNAGAEATQLVLGLVREKLQQIAGGATGEAAALATHLIPLLGLDGSVPAFPFATIASDPSALTAWLRALVAGSPPPMQTWLEHVAGLLGVTAPVVATTSGSTVWTLPVISPNASSSVDLAFAHTTAADGVTPELQTRVGVSLAPGAGAPARVDASVTLFSLPLAGAASPSAVPAASLAVAAPGDPSQPLIAPGPAFSLDAIVAGLEWNGASLLPSLQMRNVALGGTTYPTIDLTNAKTALSAGVNAAVLAALGNAGAGTHLAALAGLVEPAADPAMALVDPLKFATHPTAALAALHRAALLSAAHPWPAYFGELVALLGLAGSVAGNGTPATPWSATIASSGPLALQLVAWNAQTSGNAGDPQLLRIGLRLDGADAPLEASFTAELLGIDLPAVRSSEVALLGGYHAEIVLTLGTDVAIGGITLHATSIDATFDVSVGSAPVVAASIAGLAITTPAGTVTIPALAFPFPPGFDLTNPAATLGISVAQLESVVLALLEQGAATQLGSAGLALAALLGCTRGIPGLPGDLPVIGDPSGPGSLFSDPLGALRAWLASVASGVSASGADFATPLAAWLASLGAGTLPGDLAAAPPPASGSGTYDDPWLVPLGAADGAASGLVWLEPDGPPSTAALASAALAAAADFPSFTAAFTAASRYLPPIAPSLGAGALATALKNLSDHLDAGDGVVPFASQIPTGGTWTSGTEISAAHHLQPGDASAIAQIVAQADAWAAPGTSRAILLLGPAFADRTAWSALLAFAEVAHPGITNANADLDLRVPGVAPASVDLRGVTAVADYYTAELQDDGAGNVASLVAQIGLVLARIAALKPGAAVILVAHSTAGLAARAYAAANAASVKGLVTLGTPHGGAPLTPLTDPATGEALRALATMFPGGAGTGALHDALQHLLGAIDGYRPPASAGALPVAAPYPVGDFAGAASTDTGGVPALALGGRIAAAGADLLGALKSAASAAASAYTAAAPTHLAFGVRASLPLGSGGSIEADAAVRVDAGRVALANGAAEPARPAHALTVRVALAQPGGWLAGGPLSFAGLGAAPLDVRVRSAELGVTLSANGAVTATPFVTLHDAAYHGATAGAIAWGDALMQNALGSVFASIASTPPAASTSLGAVVQALQALGIVTVAVDGSAGASADALHALAVDPLGYLAPKASAAFAAANVGVPGFAASPNGGVAIALGGLPLEAFVTTSPAAFGVRTTGNGLAPANGVTAQLSVALQLPAATPQIGATLVAGPATFTVANGTVTLAIPPEIPSLQLVPPPSASTVAAALAAAVPDLLVSTAGSALVSSLLGPGYRVSGLLAFLRSPGAWIVRSDALGDGNALDPAKVSALLATLPALPGGFALAASGARPTTISLATSAPLGGVLSILAGVSVDESRHLAPAGTIAIGVPLPAGTWPNVSIAFGVGPGGITLTVSPGGVAPIQLLPTFSGAGALAGAAEALLPQALDALAGAIPAGALRTLALDVASALDLYDAGGGFAAHASQLEALLSGTWFSTLESTARTAFLNALVAFFDDPSSPLHGALPGAIALAGDTIAWSYPLPAAIGTGGVTVAVGWDGAGPTISAGATGVALANAPVATTVTAGYANGSLVLDAALGVSLSALGIATVPQAALGVTGGTASLAFLPLGAGTATTLSVQLLPAAKVVAGSNAGAALASAYAIPLVADLLIGATGASFTSPAWSGGPTIERILTSANLITGGAGPPPTYALKTPLPGVDAILAGVLQAVAPVSIALADSPKLTLAFVDDAGKIGVRLTGAIPLNAGDSPEISLLFGAPATWLGPDAGVTVYLFDVSGSAVRFAPELFARGLGAGLAGGGDAPLLNESGFRLGAVDAYAAFDVLLASGAISGLGGGLEIDALGLPLGQLDAASSSNPVAASLLGSDGSSGGDGAPVNPGVDVIVYDLDGSFSIQFAGTNGAVVIPVHASFGPVYVDQIDLAVQGTNVVVLGIDGEVKIAGLDVSVVELAASIPLSAVLQPDRWSLDLQGLAVSYSEDPIEIAGGLRKNPGPPVEYDGMLSATIEDIGLTVVGSYARPSDAQGGYTSLFMFVSVGVPLGGPPFAFVIGLGGGFGYNRALNVPTDLNAIDSFILVDAIDDSSLANDPMNALMSMGTAIPPRRGAFWIAAGVRFTTFALIDSTVIVAIALDRGFEIDVLGIARMALPSEDVALVSVELALKARYNSEENVLSVQAQLTDNSYLFSPDCRLTGGFAFFAWFSEGQFVLTLGGYNPAFSKPAEFPDVPRLGFQWSVGDLVVIKGGCYFALTDSCVMAGGSLSATASIGPVSAWFDAYLDFLISWDPFAYEFDIGVEIGASLDIEVCFFGCVTIGITISVGAQLAIAGPPFHGTASIDAYVTTITVSFGDPPQPPPYITDWNVFAGKYLTAGDADGTAVSLQFSKGVLTPDPPGAQPQPGTEAQPWQVGIEFAFATTTRMPATSTNDFVNGASANPIGGLNALDVAPMDLIAVTSAHRLTLEQRANDGSWNAAVLSDAADHFTIVPVNGPFPEATWHWVDPQHLPAAARTISALAGLAVDAHVVFTGQSALIPISTLVADLPQDALPLPLATTAFVSATLQAYGAAAAALAASIAGAPSASMLAAGKTILSGDGVFALNRLAFGLPLRGLAPLATSALAQARSAPPLVAPITTGLTMKPVGLPPPNLAAPLPPVAPVLLSGPRLRAMLQAIPLPVADAPPAARTSVTTLAQATLARAPRTIPPSPAAVAGARLLVVPAANAPRPTTAAQRPRAIRNADLGAATGPAHQQTLAKAAADLVGGGVTLGAGAAHLWELANGGGTFTFAGDGCVRIVCTDRAGGVLSDVELAAAQSPPRPIPENAEMVLVQALGAAPPGATLPPPAFGALTTAYAPAGATAAVGWQSGSTLMQIGPSRFAARGSTLRVARPHATSRNRQRASNGTALARDVVAGQIGVETTLPASIGVVLIALDGADAGAPQTADLAIGVTGATLATPPQRVSAGNRRLLLYDLAAHDDGAPPVVVSVAGSAGWTLAGVAGVAGTALEWATALHGGIPDNFVTDGPLAPGGTVTASYAPGAHA